MVDFLLLLRLLQLLIRRPFLLPHLNLAAARLQVYQSVNEAPLLEEVEAEAEEEEEVEAEAEAEEEAE